MLTFACVEWGNFQGRGGEYVAKMRAMAARHLPAARFVCLTDDAARHPGIACQPLGAEAWTLPGCFAKLQLFKPGRFEGRVLYLDIDSVVVASLEPLVAQKGAVYLEDWGWARHCLAGGHLVWDAGEHEELYHGVTREVVRRHPNEQEWMTVVGGWDRLPPALCRSYRYHCKQGVPAEASVVAFHGKPKMHEVADAWVREHWG